MTNPSDLALADPLLDPDIEETEEWLESLESVIENEGIERAHFLIERLIKRARRRGGHLPYTANTAYVNTIQVSKEQKKPGDSALEWRLRSYIRWNAMAMVVRANKKNR